MKKICYLFAFLTVLVFASCNKDSDDVNTQSFTSTINTRCIENGSNDVKFSQGTANVDLDLSNYTIKFTATATTNDNQTFTFTTSTMQMTQSASYIYSFTESSVSSGANISGLTGYLDLATGVMWYRFNVEGQYTVYSSTHLVYAYTTTVITSPQGATFDHTQSAYLFAMNSTGTSCVLQISNFIPNTSGSVQASLIEYDGLAVTPTLDGYHVTADSVPSSYSSYYAITDLDINLTDNGKVVSGSFTANEHVYTLNGKLFNTPN